MKKRIIFSIISILALIFGLLSGCGHKREVQTSAGYPNSSPKIHIDEKEMELWKSTVSVHLQDDLWSDKNAYDAGHYLMVLLHAAFYSGEEALQREFAEHFSRFMVAVKKSPQSIASNRLDQLHYLYLASRFVVLAEQYGRSYLIPDGLVDLLYKKIEDIWINEPAWQWGREPFKGGMRERILWKLRHKDVPKSYYRAIIDEELFTIAIAADLRAYERLAKDKTSWSPVVTDILEIARNIFQQEGEFRSDGGWLFQPGVWSDSPSYAYAGHTVKKIGMKPKPVPGIAWDTSHSHRFPLWLTSLEGAYAEGEPGNEMYKKIKRGLEKQFYEHVLVQPTQDFPAYRTTNYMDGRNGIYRWNYRTLKNDGYGPYELSGTLTLGWWAFLASERIQSVYRQIAEKFPLPSEVVSLYVGPNTTRERHVLVKWPDAYYNGYIELIVNLAAKL